MSATQCNGGQASAKINISYSILFNLTTSYFSYFGGKKGISRNKTSFFLLMGAVKQICCFPIWEGVCSDSKNLMAQFYEQQ